MVTEEFKEIFSRKEVQRFLYSLYKLSRDKKADRAKRQTIIRKASSFEINVLVKVLRLIADKQIKLRQKDVDIIKKSKKLNFILDHFQEDDGYKKIKESSLEHKKQVCAKINTYHELFYRIFNKR